MYALPIVSLFLDLSFHKTFVAGPLSAPLIPLSGLSRDYSLLTYLLTYLLRWVRAESAGAHTRTNKHLQDTQSPNEPVYHVAASLTDVLTVESSAFHRWTLRQWRTMILRMLIGHRYRQQESCAIAKMTARCALSWGVAEIWPFEIIQDAGAILNLFESKIAPLDPPSPKKLYPRTKHEVDRITRCRDMAIRVCWGHMKPQFLAGRGSRRASAMAPLERAMVVSYRLSIVTVALSVTIQPQFAIVCLRRSNRQGVGHFGPKFSGVPLGADPLCWGCKERTSQAN